MNTRVDARAEQGDGWDGFDEGQPDPTALLSLQAAAEGSVAAGTHPTVEAFLAEVEQYAHDADLVPVDLGEVPPPADETDPAGTEGGTVTDITNRPAKATAVKKATKKSTPPK